jgi:malonate decarboxylase alpha subunit
LKNCWNKLAVNYAGRMARGGEVARDKLVAVKDVVSLLERVIESGDRVCIEGDNQKHADFLSSALAKVDPSLVHDLQIVQSNIALPQHLDVFERGIARTLDFCYSGAQGLRLAHLIRTGKVKLGAIHTYLELYSRYFVDLSPRVSLIAAEAADKAGNLYTGDNTEDTPAIAEATAFRQGVLVAQVNRIVDKVPRVDVPGDWVSFVIQAPRPNIIEPIFTRDPAQISELEILMAMMVIDGIYAPYGVIRLNHGIGFDTAAIELLLPTYAARRGLKGKICRYMTVNPCPTLIPAIESGFVESIHCAGSEVGMEAYTAARPDIFFMGRDGSMRSNRAFCQLAGHYADLFIGSTLQIDLEGNSSTATRERMTGFGGAPNFGSESRSRRHSSPTWLKAGQEDLSRSGKMPRGRKLVVQIVKSFKSAGEPTFVERLDAWELQRNFNLELPPVMIYGDDVTHIVTEEGIANLLLCAGLAEREQAIRGIAGFTDIGRGRDSGMVESLRARGAVRYPEDMGIDKTLVSRELLAARSVRDLVRWSGGLYTPPSRFRNW